MSSQNSFQKTHYGECGTYKGRGSCAHRNISSSFHNAVNWQSEINVDLHSAPGEANSVLELQLV
jgi:hypothetical protein